MKREIRTDGAPLPIGPYSQAVEYGGLIFVSGQIPIDSSGQLRKEDIEEETVIVLDNIKNILQKAGSDFTKVIYVQIFLKDIDDFAKVNKVYERYFTKPFPARAVVGGVDIPGGANIEITLMAYK